MALPVRLPLSLSSALLTACAMHGFPLQTECTNGICKATVAVQSCDTGKLTVVPEPITVPAPNNIEWTISTADYKFPPNGIVVDGNGFTDPHVTGSGKKFMVHDDWSDKSDKIKYTVRVVRESDGRACAPYDPFIKNQ